jgi:hypothetical protein
MRKSVRLKRLPILVAVAAVACCAAEPQALKLDVDPVNLGDGGKVEFRAIQTDDEHLSAGSNIGQSAHFQIYTVPGVATYNDDLRVFKYDLLVNRVSSGRPEWTHFELTAAPSGPFLDQVHDLTFTITEGKNAERGQMRLPLHSVSNEQYLDAATASAIVDVRLGSDQSIPIQLKNKLQDMKVLVQSVRLDYRQRDFWKTSPAQLTLNLTVPEGGTVTLDDLKLHANPAKAVPITFFQLKNNEATGITMNIAYAAQSGGKPKEVPVEIKVRFIPSLLYLFLAILGGALLGSTGRLIDQRRETSPGAWGMTFLTALVGATILELIGIVLVSLNSEFKVFGIVLDPFQLPQVIVMAILVGVLGVNISDMVRQVVTGKGKGPRKRGAAAARSGD